jgi:hypothetical protein
VLRYSRSSQETGIHKGEYARVTQVDAPNNRLTVEMKDGTEKSYDPRRQQGVSVYREQERAFSTGDRVQLTAPVSTGYSSTWTLSLERKTCLTTAWRMYRFRVVPTTRNSSRTAARSWARRSAMMSRTQALICPTRSRRNVSLQRHPNRRRARTWTLD